MAKKPVKVETLTHDKAARRNIPTAEYQSVAERIEEQNPAEPTHYRRARPLAEGATRERDEDLDPQIVWRGARIRVSKEQARQLLERARSRSATRSSSGGARIGRTGPTSSFRHRPSTSRRKYTPRRSSTT